MSTTDYPVRRVFAAAVAASGALALLAVVGPTVLPDGATLAVVRQLLEASLGSLSRLLPGLALGLLAGSLVGLSMAAWPLADRVLGSLVHPLRQMPLFGWIALLGLWAGFGELSKVIFIALAVSYTMVIAAYQALRSVPARLDEVARVCRLGWGSRVRTLLLPALLPGWLGGLRIALAVAWSATIGAEILMGASSAGLGGYIWGQREVGRFDLVLLGTALIGVFAILSDRALGRAERGLRRWLRLL